MQIENACTSCKVSDYLIKRKLCTICKTTGLLTQYQTILF